MKRARKYSSKIVAEIKANQDPMVAARNKKKLVLAAIIVDALESKKVQRSELAERLDKYSSEISKWTSGFHNFTVDTLSDIEEILGIQVLPNYDECFETAVKNPHLRPIEHTIYVGSEKMNVTGIVFYNVQEILRSSQTSSEEKLHISTDSTLLGV